MNKTTFTVAAIAAAAQAVNTQEWMNASLKTFLAQVEQSNRKHTCSHAQQGNHPRGPVAPVYVLIFVRRIW